MRDDKLGLCVCNDKSSWFYLCVCCSFPRLHFLAAAGEWKFFWPMKLFCLLICPSMHCGFFAKTADEISCCCPARVEQKKITNVFRMRSIFAYQSFNLDSLSLSLSQLFIHTTCVYRFLRSEGEVNSFSFFLLSLVKKSSFLVMACLCGCVSRRVMRWMENVKWERVKWDTLDNRLLKWLLQPSSPNSLYFFSVPAAVILSWHWTTRTNTVTRKPHCNLK